MGDRTAYPELSAITGPVLPDYRGVFLRGHGGNSAGIGMLQEDTVGPHNHYTNIDWRVLADWEPPDDCYVPFAGGSRKTLSTGDGIGIETRPVNRAVVYLVRAR